LAAAADRKKFSATAVIAAAYRVYLYDFRDIGLQVKKQIKFHCFSAGNFECFFKILSLIYSFPLFRLLTSLGTRSPDPDLRA